MTDVRKPYERGARTGYGSGGREHWLHQPPEGLERTAKSLSAQRKDATRVLPVIFPVARCRCTQGGESSKGPEPESRVLKRQSTALRFTGSRHLIGTVAHQCMPPNSNGLLLGKHDGFIGCRVAPVRSACDSSPVSACSLVSNPVVVSGELKVCRLWA